MSSTTRSTISRPRRRHGALGAMALLAASALLVGCSDSRDTPLLSGLGDGPSGSGEIALGEVRTGLSCDEVIELAEGRLLADIDAMESFDVGTEEGLVVESDAAPASTAAPTGAAGADELSADMATSDGEGRVVAGTNVREVGVDESDLVKTDGRRIVSVLDGTLRVVGLDGTPELDGTLAVGRPGAGDVAELFLRGDEALVLISTGMYGYDPVMGGGGPVMEDVGPVTGSAAAEPDIIVPETVPDTTVPDTTVPDTTVPDTTVPDTTVPDTTVPDTTVPDTIVPPPEPPPFDQGVTLVRVDLSDPGNPREVERTTVEGSLVAARMVDGTARVVVRSTPPVMADMWSNGDVDSAREAVEDLDVEDLLPRMATDGEVAPLGDCDDLSVLPTPPADAVSSGMAGTVAVPSESTVSVLTVGDTLAELSPATIQGMADVVYASPTALYVSAYDWSQGAPATAVHRFETAGTEGARYTGSGRVPGSLLDDYSLSEADGDLRVVTTVEGPIATGTMESDDEVATTLFDPDTPVEDVAPVPATEGRLTVLRPDADGALVEVGRVEDLGEGERVQSVRYVGDLAYVVTFRQTDPLYAIDLSDPTAPRVLGELKVTGFSEYLHPVSDDLLLGLGREATDEGMDTGFKVALYDVTDPTAPAELDRIVIPDGWSLVAGDAHAFTWDPEAGHAVFPIERAGTSSCPQDVECFAGPGEPTTGALVVAVRDGQLEEVAELRHDGEDPWSAQIVRSMVVDRDLWTLSGVGLGRSDADAPTTVELIPF